MSSLPPEEQPPGNLAPGDPPEDWIGSETPDNPLFIAAAFYRAATDEEGPRVDDLRLLSTRESVTVWGTYDHACDLLAGRGMASRFERHPSQQVVYVRFTPGLKQDMVSTGDASITDVVIMTLLWQDDMWKVHRLGDYWQPDGPQAG